MLARFVAAVLTVLVPLPPVVYAQQGARKEQALAATVADPQLKWGPCPPFIPEGCEIALLHRDPANANADVFFKVPASLIFALTGTPPQNARSSSGELQVTYDGQEPVTLKPGMYAYGPAKLPHKGSCAKDDPCVLFVAFESAVDAHTEANKAK